MKEKRRTQIRGCRLCVRMLLPVRRALRGNASWHVRQHAHLGVILHLPWALSCLLRSLAFVVNQRFSFSSECFTCRRRAAEAAPALPALPCARLSQKRSPRILSRRSLRDTQKTHVSCQMHVHQLFLRIFLISLLWQLAQHGEARKEQKKWHRKVCHQD